MRGKENKGITLIALVITIIVLLILAGVAIATLTGENGLLTKTKVAKERNDKAQAEEEVKLAATTLRIEASQRSLSDDEKVQILEKELTTSYPKQEPETIVNKEGTKFKVTHRGYEFEIDSEYKVLSKETFNAEEWDKTACKETSFLWESDDPNSGEAYHKIIGYADSITNETKLKIPSRCHEIRSNVGNWNSVGRTFSANNFTNIEFPETIEKIGDNAFSGFISLTNITIPNGVTVIDISAFCGCTSLTSVTIPDSVTEINTSAFRNCTGLINIIISNNYSAMISGGGGEWSAFANTAWWNNQPNEELVYIGKVAYGYKGTMPNNTTIEIKEGTKIIGR